jgi:hypothetical protein
MLYISLEIFYHLTSPKSKSFLGRVFITEEIKT